MYYISPPESLFFNKIFRGFRVEEEKKQTRLVFDQGKSFFCLFQFKSPMNEITLILFCLDVYDFILTIIVIALHFRSQGLVFSRVGF